MGSAHDRDNSKTTGGALQYGRFAYSFGYKTAAAAGNFYTVMAYGDTGQTAHRIFSTPQFRVLAQFPPHSIMSGGYLAKTKEP